jgi:hypothetical protein
MLLNHGALREIRAATVLKISPMKVSYEETKIYEISIL